MGNMNFGIELECITKVNDSTIKTWLDSKGLLLRGWTVKYDSSIRTEIRFPYSQEVVSPILDFSKDSDKADLKEVMQYLMSVGKVNQSCGTHVHTDARDFDISILKNFCRLYSRLEPVMTKFVPESRVSGQYSIPWFKNESSNFGPDALVKSSSMRNFEKVWYHGRTCVNNHYDASRYKFVNLHSFVEHGSIEFRAHQGTLNYGKICRWIEVCLALLNKAREVKFGYVKQVKIVEINNKINLSFDAFKKEFKNFCTRLELRKSVVNDMLERAKRFRYVNA